ncbi:PMT-domain-containing protein [Hesseltinella vesiculosa]|uniref:Dolichyl-phosphate-mannose--protein mannosyltransferase n=1 Tax=Hesseltinella vesiculosa TaxID=101127 RepID=A0A1X2GND0_9FUNG|nr:PMT-domain-containing protein [Hesseltinella vesiculosa]
MDNLKRRHKSAADELYTSHEAEDHEKLYKQAAPHQLHRTQYQPITYSTNKFIAYAQKNYSFVIPTALTLLAFYTRFRLIGISNFVVWDEAHFGKFGSHYLKNEFYFDVHPPLGKMLVGLSGALAGYNGDFEFTSGATYPEGMHYGFMRVFNALFGALIVPLAYLTARECHMSIKASILAATMVLFDTALLCISRFILLDSMLLFFTCLTFYCLMKFHNERQYPFTEDWWLWLTLTGVSLGCVSSVKWVGLFSVALVGLYTIEDLWEKLGDLTMPKMTYLKHWVSRGVCLIALPICVYILSFAIHFAILYRSGPGDAQMSSLFQANLEGSSLGQNPLELVYGSRLTIKNFGYAGGLLHSHSQTYPEGSKQQQITCYHHKDDNNHWVIKAPRTGDGTTIEEINDEEARFVKDGDVVRLMHLKTGRNLHSHPVAAPVSNSQWEVSGYGDEEVGDLQDNWKIEVVDDLVHRDTETGHIRSLTTLFRIRHVSQNCLLTADNTVLPQWGYKQIEVYCDKRNNDDNPHSWWNIEEHFNEMLPPAPKNAYKTKFFKDFWHLNVAMWTSNNALVPDPDKDDILSSEPLDWPLALVGLRMCGWEDDRIKYYLIGNPIVWWSSFLSVIAFGALTAFYLIRMQRSIYDLSKAQWQQFFFMGKTIALGWALHYIPFFIMGRVTYLHHYFPALYFSIFMMPYLLDQYTLQLRTETRAIIFGSVFALIVLVFVYFSPFVYGMTGPAQQFAGRKWLDSWNMV